MIDEIKPCPFCGSSLRPQTLMDQEQGMKWGYAYCGECGARGPEVRTQYDAGTLAPWRAEAIAEWNRRA